MKITLSTTQAAELLKADENANWSYAGALALVEYFEEIEEAVGIETELDVVAIRCDFSEYESAIECLRDYMTADQYTDEFGCFEEMGEDCMSEHEGACLEYLRENTIVIEFDGGIIIQSF